MTIDGPLGHRVEAACLMGWPALHEAQLDGWLLRFAEGHTRRANSVNPLRQGTRDVREKIRECQATYRAQGLPTIFRLAAPSEPGLDAALDALGYRPPEDETCVIYRSLLADDIDTHNADFCEVAPGEEWLKAHARCTGNGEAAQRAQRKILQALRIPAVFTAMRSADGGLGSLAFGAVHDEIVCINLVVTDPAWRRHGLSRRAVSAVLAWARDRAGAQGACLSVVASNLPARTLYQQLGFETELYRYHYRRGV